MTIRLGMESVVAGAILMALTMSAGAAVEHGNHRVKAWRGDKASVKPKEFATNLVGDFPSVPPTPSNRLDQYGGLLGQSQHATGFFYAKKIGQRWWLIDPSGNRFIDVGVAGLRPNFDSPTAHRTFNHKFGSLQTWANDTLQLLRSNGFNSGGGFSDNQAIYSKKFVYTPTWDFMASFGRSINDAHQGTGHSAYNGDCIPVFDPRFPSFCDHYAQQLADRKNDPYLLGCYSDNELPFPINSLDRFLKLGPQNPGRVAAESLLRKRHASANHLNSADRQAWMYELADRYFSIVSAAIHKYDPNHMYMGCRFNGPAGHNEALFRAAGKYVDVISYNLYGVWTPTIEPRQEWAKWSGKPCLITEFYAKGVDSGMKNDTGAGWLVATQKQRGEFYQTFTLGLLRSDACVGWQWFKYQDNLPDDMKADRSNRRSNKGIVNGQYAPYKALLEEMKPLNERVYSFAKYFDHR